MGTSESRFFGVGEGKEKGMVWRREKVGSWKFDYKRVGRRKLHTNGQLLIASEASAQIFDCKFPRYYWFAPLLRIVESTSLLDSLILEPRRKVAL